MKQSKTATRFFSWPTLLLLVAILAIGASVRLWQLGSIPSILNRDEAALAYNALLLKETGQDEWGRPWPLALESFGDYKLPGYPMLLVGFFSLFGLSDMIVRLPSAVAGIALIGVSFLVCRSLGWRRLSAVSAALLMAVTPVFIFYARIAFEANVALFFFVLSWWLLLLSPRSTQSASRWPSWLSDVLAIGVMVAAVFTYNTPFLLLPFVIVILPLMRGLKAWQNWLLPVIGLSAVFLLSASIFLPITAQKSSITIFSDETVWRESVLYREQFTGIWQRTLGNKYVYMAQLVAKNYLASIAPTFMVLKGGTHPWHQAVGSGHLSWVTYLLGWVGIGAALKASWQFAIRRQGPPPWPALLLLYWLLTGLVPAVITVDAPHATRSLFFLWAWVMAAGWGVSILVQLLRKFRLNWIPRWAPAASIVLGAFLIAVGVTTAQYVAHYFGPFASSHPMWKPSYQSALALVNRDRPTDPIAVVDPDGYQYILTAWYTRMPASEYAATVIRQQPSQIGFRYGEQVGRWHFIADDDDRQAEEKGLISWQDGQWQVQLF